MGEREGGSERGRERGGGGGKMGEREGGSERGREEEGEERWERGREGVGEGGREEEGEGERRGRKDGREGGREWEREGERRRGRERGGGRPPFPWQSQTQLQLATGNHFFTNVLGQLANYEPTYTESKVYCCHMFCILPRPVLESLLQYLHHLLYTYR